MVSALASGSSGADLSLGRGHCVGFLGKNTTPRCINGYRRIKLGSPVMDKHPVLGVVEILLVTLC